MRSCARTAARRSEQARLVKKVFIKSYGCQMNVYDAERMADVLAPEGFAETADDRRRPTSSSSTPATSARRRPRRSIPSSAACGRRSAPGRPGAARRRSSSRAASPRPRAREILRRAPVVDVVVGPQSYHRLPDAPRPRAARARRRRHRLPGRGQVRPSARAGARPRPRRLGLPHRPGRLRQVLHLLRRALHARRRGLAAGRQDPRARPSASPTPGVREITLIGQNVNAYHGEGPDGRVWSLARLLRAPRRDPGHRAPALHDEPSARHGRRPDRRPSRPAGADALSAPAGAGRLRPRARGDEPQAHAATTTAA